MRADPEVSMAIQTSWNLPMESISGTPPPLQMNSLANWLKGMTHRSTYIFLTF